MANLERAYADDIKIRVADEKLRRRHRDRGQGVRPRRRGLREERREGDRLRGRPRRRHQALLRLSHRIWRPRRGVLGRHALQRECHQARHGRRPAGARGGDRAAGTDEGGLYPAHHRRITPRPTTAGRVFAQTRPKLAAYTHIVQLASAGAAADARRMSRRPARPTTARSRSARI